jgi:hypothetical protein
MQGAEKIISTEYDAAAEQLVVTFESGRSFVFADVPAIVAGLLAVEADPVTYFEGWIRGQFTWTELETDTSVQFVDLVGSG